MCDCVVIIIRCLLEKGKIVLDLLMKMYFIKLNLFEL